jgi:RecA/RadA recombinase
LVQKSFRNGKDVADSLRKMEKMDMATNMPTRRISQETNADNKAVKQEGFDILYKAEIDMYTKRKHELKDNMNKTYSLIYLQHCNKTIQDRIMAHPEFESKIKKNPIKLLKAVKILIIDPVRARYPYASATKVMTRSVTCRQLENESLADYIRHFKGNCETAWH